MPVSKTKTTSKRPDLRNYFRSRIDTHVNGVMSASAYLGSRSMIPADVQKIDGTITDPVITVTMRDGTQWQWQGGRYASRKANGCYAPLMPKPIDAAS